MDQKDVDIIIECRAVLDKYRAFNKARIESLGSSKSIDEAKTYIESKIGATTITADRALKSKDTIKELLEDERTKYTLEITKVMQKHGFVNENKVGSVQKFKEWYEPLILKLYKECVPIHGECDFCGEKALIDQPCVKFYKTKDLCTITAQGVTDGIYQSGLLLRRRGLVFDDESIRRGHCLKGHGFWGEPSEYKALPDGITFEWTV